MDNKKELLEEIEQNEQVNLLTDTNEVVPKKREKKKHKVLNAFIITIVCILVLAIGTGVYITEPWVPQEKTDTTLEVEYITESIALKVGETVDVRVLLGDNETASYESDCPDAVSVDDEGLITANAMHDAVISVMVSEIEYPKPPPLSQHDTLRSELRILIGLDEPIDYSAFEPRELRQVHYIIKITGYEWTVHEDVIEMEVGETYSLKLDDSRRKIVFSDDTVISCSGKDEVIKALSPGQSSMTIIYGILGKADGKTVFLEQKKEVYFFKVNEPPVEEEDTGDTNRDSGNKNGTGGSRGGSGGNSTGGGSGGSGGGTSGGGSTGGGNTGGGGTTTPSRPYPLPSESEVKSFCATALAYANGLGMGTNSSLNKGNSGYMGPACTWEMPWENVKNTVYWQIDRIASLIIGDGGQLNGDPMIKLHYEFFLEEWYIYVLYG